MEADHVKDLLIPAKQVLSRISRINVLKLGMCFISNSKDMTFLTKNVKDIMVDLVYCDAVNALNKADVYVIKIKN